MVRDHSPSPWMGSNLFFSSEMPGIDSSKDWIKSNFRSVVINYFKASGDATFASGEVNHAWFDLILNLRILSLKEKLSLPCTLSELEAILTGRIYPYLTTWEWLGEIAIPRTEFSY